MRDFGVNLMCAFKTVVGLATSDEQWGQAGLRVKQSGLGLTLAGDIADAGYRSSRDATYDNSRSLDGGHVWDDGAPCENQPLEV